MRFALFKVLPLLLVLSTCTEEDYRPPPRALNVHLTGDVEVGSVLTGRYDFSGGSNVQGSSRYQWLISEGAKDRGVKRIAGATQSTYTPTLGDEGKFVAFEVMPIDSKNDTGRVAHSPFQRVGSPSVPIALNVFLAGNVTAQQALIGAYDFTGGTGREGNSQYRWFIADSSNALNGVRQIANATQRTYKTTLQEVGKFIAFEVVPVDNAGASGKRVRSEFRLIEPPYPIALDVDIGGKLVVGDTLIGHYNVQINGVTQEQENSKYQWLYYNKDFRTGKLTLTPILGANGKNYLPQVGDEGRFIVFEVLPIDVTGLLFGKSVRSVPKKIVSTETYRLYFITTWRVSNEDRSITIPIATDNTYSYDIDWNEDGVFEENAIRSSATHTFPAAGEYTVFIRGLFPRIYFNNTGDKDKIISVDQWGINAWSSMAHAFHGCTNLQVKASDGPDLVTNSPNSMEFMFSGATSLNQNIGHWQVALVKSMESLFQNAAAFNQDLSSWNTKNVENMANMFNGATSFDQEIGSWKVGKVKTMSDMFKGVTLSTSNYDHLLIGWNTQDLQPGVRFHGGNSTYSSAAMAAHNNLFSPAGHDWMLQADGGRAP